MLMLPLPDMIGTARADALTRLWVDETMLLDGFPQDLARRVVERRIADGDPLLLAATGQIWVLTDEELLDQVPAVSLRVEAMVGPDHGLPVDVEGKAMFFRSLDPGADSTVAVSPVTLLRSYQLQSWNTPTVDTDVQGGGA
jgi:hypothetical protein